MKHCQFCERPMPLTRRKGSKYCSLACQRGEVHRLAGDAKKRYDVHKQLNALFARIPSAVW